LKTTGRVLGGIVAAGLAIAACSGDDDGALDVSGAVSTAAPLSDPAGSEPAATVAPATDAPAESTSTAPTSEPVASTATIGSAPAEASGSGLDESFGEAGLLATPISVSEDDRFISVAEGPDGSIYASGFSANGEDHAFAVTRFTAAGAVDASFGAGGTVVVNVAEAAGAEVARGLVVQDDGFVVVSGPFESGFDGDEATPDDLDVAVVRIAPDGTLDASFGDEGIARIDLGAGKQVDEESFITDNAWGLTTRDGGYAVMAVTPNQAADRTDSDFAVVGLTTTGDLDPSFGSDGVLIADVDASADSARNIATAADGTLVATGYSRDVAGVVRPVLIKASAAGQLDATFGVGGVVTHTVLDGVTESYQLAAQGDDFVLAGYGRGASDEKVDVVVYRFLADGSLDSSFGTNGVTRIDLAGQDDRGRNLTVLPDGNIMIVGSGKLDADNGDAMVVLLDADGAPVESFGESGHLLVDLGGPADAFFGMMLNSDQSAVWIAGFKGADPEGDDNDDAVLARVAI